MELDSPNLFFCGERVPAKHITLVQKNGMKKALLIALASVSLSAQTYAKSGKLSDTVTVAGAVNDHIALTELMKDPSVESHLCGYQVASFKFYVGRPKCDVRAFKIAGSKPISEALEYLTVSPAATRVVYDDIVLSNGNSEVKTGPIILKLK